MSDGNNGNNEADQNDFFSELIQSQQPFTPLAIDVIGHSIICPCCMELVDDLEFRRRHTYYANEEANLIVACAECQRADADYWADMWLDYWSGVR